MSLGLIRFNPNNLLRDYFRIDVLNLSFLHLSYELIYLELLKLINSLPNYKVQTYNLYSRSNQLSYFNNQSIIYHSFLFYFYFTLSHITNYTCTDQSHLKELSYPHQLSTMKGQYPH